MPGRKIELETKTVAKDQKITLSSMPENPLLIKSGNLINPGRKNYPFRLPGESNFPSRY